MGEVIDACSGRSDNDDLVGNLDSVLSAVVCVGLVGKQVGWVPFLLSVL